jgi:glycosyltransferase involved in cell wall biosynthesis
MRVLFLTPEVPHPPDSGGRIKTSTVLDYLRARHDVAVLCFRRRPVDEAQQRWAAGLPRVRTLPLNRGRDAGTLFRSYVHGVPLSIERNRIAAMATMVEEEIAGASFDAVFVDHWLMAQYVPASFRGLRLLHEHNAESLIWKRQAARSGNPLLKLEARRVKSYEAGLLSRFDKVFAVSSADREALIDLGAPAERVEVLPNIPDPDLLQLPPLTFEQAETAVAYLGTLSWQPNIDGLTRFATEVFPMVNERMPDCRFLVAGRDAPSNLVTVLKRIRGVEFLGDISDPEALYRRARVMVEATETGGGTKLKILNSLARGLPVVASPEAAEGLAVCDGADIVIARSDVTMAESIVRLLGDADLWRRLADGGRDLVRRDYVAEVAFQPLDRALSGAPVT